MPSRFEILREAAADTTYVSGLTHNFYRYPARFSPAFAAAAIDQFSRPGELVLDPFMGGGTVVVEANVAGRSAIGGDISSLSTFVTRAKTTVLRRGDIEEIAVWSRGLVDEISYAFPASRLTGYLNHRGAYNLQLPAARPIKKAVAIALRSSETLSSRRAREFTRCVILRTAQWALDGRRTATSLSDFRTRLVANTWEMLEAIRAFARRVRPHRYGRRRRQLLKLDARDIDSARPFRDRGESADMVLTSPPYPGIHVLYHRWQVDGRRETPAPFWIAASADGKGLSHYTFGDRREPGLSTYFNTLRSAYESIRCVVRPGAYVVQLVAFGEPRGQLRRFLRAMSAAGFDEAATQSGSGSRIWRHVPNRKWYASMKGESAASREVVLVHRAV